MPLQSTSGAASYDAFGGGAAAKVNYIEDFFQSYLRTGTGASATVTTGLDGSTKETLVWTKSRSAATNHKLTDNVRGATKALSSNTTGAESTDSQGLTAFSATGYTIGTNTDYNNSGATYVDWQWVAQPKFFDVVTYTGTGVTTGRTIAHSLGSNVGALFVKCTSNPSDWPMWHNTFTGLQGMYLNTTGSKTVNTFESKFGNGTTVVAPTSSVFTVGIDLNESGFTYVAYLFAHDAGGFGLTGTDNVISCGSVTRSGSSVIDVNLGYEPQWVLFKSASNANNWRLFDVMRGMPITGDQSELDPNLSDAEGVLSDAIYPTSTGFAVNPGSGIFGGGDGSTSIYIAIRRGPMKVPTSGTSVFYPTGWTGSMATRTNTTGFVTDLNISRMWFNFSSASNLGAYWENRLTGRKKYLHSDATDAEASQTDGLTSFASNTGITFGADSTVQAWNYDNNYRNWSFKRAPSYMDVVCYTGTGASSQVLTHNLTVTPQLTIFKKRSASNPWDVVSGNTSYLQLNENFAASPDTSIAATATTITAPLGAGNGLNASGATYVAYLFATCAGVSKVGSYTGNGSSQTINCGFTAGARFVMVKATSTTGNWIVADTNSIASDRALYMNNADREVSGNDWIDIASSGFIVNQTATIAANTNGVTYIFLAIA